MKIHRAYRFRLYPTPEQLLSNLAYNISQPAVSLDDHTRRAASRCLEAWDTARREHRAALALARKRKAGAK